MTTYCNAVYPLNGYDREAEAPTVGGGSALFTHRGVLPESNHHYAQASLVFWDGDVVVEILVTDFTDAMPTTESLAGLAASVVDRLQRARDGEAPGLGLMHPRYDGEMVMAAESAYRLSGDAVLPWYQAEASDLDRYLQLHAASGVEDAYSWLVRLPGIRDDGLHNWLGGTALSFGTEEAARIYLSLASNVEVGVSPPIPARPRDGAPLPQFGDESRSDWFWVENRYSEIPLHGWQGMIRVGSVVSVVWFEVDREIVPEDAIAVGELVAECMATRHCTEMVGLPNTMKGVGPGLPKVEASPVADDGAAAVIEMHDIYFAPRQITLPADQTSIVRIVNRGVARHNFSIDSPVMDVDLAPGESEDVTITLPAGTYDFYCDIPGHREVGMTGTLVVE
ncbi:MAG: cupredoxin domain-containing protein [Ilumatobacteraceae bacterium]